MVEQTRSSMNVRERKNLQKNYCPQDLTTQANKSGGNLLFLSHAGFLYGQAQEGLSATYEWLRIPLIISNTIMLAVVV